MSRHGTLGRIGGMIPWMLLLGGCPVMGNLQVGDLTLGLQNGFAALGSHVGFVLH